MIGWQLRTRALPVCLLLGLVVAVSFGTLAMVKLLEQGERRYCRVVLVDAMGTSHIGGREEFTDHRSFLCEVVSESGRPEEFLSLTMPDQLLAANIEALQRNEWFVEYNSDWVQSDKKVVVPSHETLEGVSDTKQKELSHLMDGFKESKRRVQAGETDFRKLLIVRVSALDETPIYSGDEMYDIIMGDQEDSYKSQIRACSQGVVEVVDPIELPRVVDVTIPKNIAEYTHESLFFDAIDALLEIHQVDSMRNAVEHALFVAPSGLLTTDGAVEVVGAAGYNNYMVILADTWIDAAMLLLHETSHNRGVGHAWLGDQEYGDLSSVMGAPSRAYRSCFNGLHFQDLGWMMDRTVVIDPLDDDDPKVVELVAFTDYKDSTDGQATVLQVGSYSLTYNRAKSFNADVGARQDQVVIVEQKKPIVEDPLSSSFVYAIDGSDRVFSGLDDAGSLLTIEVCEVETSPDRMILAVGSGAGSCPEPTQSPTVNIVERPPTSSPTVRPTVDANVVERPPSSSMIPEDLFEPVFEPDRKHNLRSEGECDDDTSALFYVDPKFGYQRCSWLKTYFDAVYNETHSVLDAVCVPGQPASEHCEETCGMCTDTCDDDPDARTTFLSINVSCEWIARRSFFWTLACSMEGFQEACPETCNRCADT